MRGYNLRTDASPKTPSRRKTSTDVLSPAGANLVLVFVSLGKPICEFPSRIIRRLRLTPARQAATISGRYDFHIVPLLFEKGGEKSGTMWKSYLPQNLRGN